MQQANADDDNKPPPRPIPLCFQAAFGLNAQGSLKRIGRSKNRLPTVFRFKPELPSQFIRHGIAGAGAGAAGAGADNGVKGVNHIQLQIQLVFADGNGLG